MGGNWPNGRRRHVYLVGTRRGVGCRATCLVGNFAALTYGVMYIFGAAPNDCSHLHIASVADRKRNCARFLGDGGTSNLSGISDREIGIGTSDEILG